MVAFPSVQVVARHVTRALGRADQSATTPHPAARRAQFQATLREVWERDQGRQRPTAHDQRPTETELLIAAWAEIARDTPEISFETFHRVVGGQAAVRDLGGRRRV